MNRKINVPTVEKKEKLVLVIGRLKFMPTFIASFHAWKKDDLATVAFFLLFQFFV